MLSKNFIIFIAFFKVLAMQAHFGSKLQQDQAKKQSKFWYFKNILHIMNDPCITRVIHYMKWKIGLKKSFIT